MQFAIILKIQKKNSVYQPSGSFPNNDGKMFFQQNQSLTAVNLSEHAHKTKAELLFKNYKNFFFSHKITLTNSLKRILKNYRNERKK